MLPDRVSNPGPLAYESCALPIALRGPAKCSRSSCSNKVIPVVIIISIRYNNMMIIIKSSIVP